MKKTNILLSSLSSIWVSPQRTIQNIIDEDSININPLLIILGCFSFFLYISINSIDGNSNLIIIIARCMVAGVFFSPFILYAGGFLIHLTGKPVGGRARTKNIQTVLAWSQIPIISMLIIWPLAIYFFGESIFLAEILANSPVVANQEAYILFILIYILMVLWSLVILVLGLRQVQKISFIKSVINAFLFFFLAFTSAIAVSVGVIRLIS